MVKAYFPGRMEIASTEPQSALAKAIQAALVDDELLWRLACAEIAGEDDENSLERLHAWADKAAKRAAKRVIAEFRA